MKNIFDQTLLGGLWGRMFTRLFVYPRKAGVEGAESICNPVSCYFFLIGFAFKGKIDIEKPSQDTKTLLRLKYWESFQLIKVLTDPLQNW